MSLFTGNHVEKNRRCCDSIRCCTIATMDYGTDPISSFAISTVYLQLKCLKKSHNATCVANPKTMCCVEVISFSWNQHVTMIVMPAGALATKREARVHSEPMPHSNPGKLSSFRSSESFLLKVYNSWHPLLPLLQKFDNSIIPKQR